MAIQFLLVTFPEQRTVLADGEAVGVTNHILMLPADEYQIGLDGGGYAPASQDVALDGTSMVRPLVIAFAPAALAPADVASGARLRGAPVSRGAQPTTTSGGKPANARKVKTAATVRGSGRTSAKEGTVARASTSTAKEKPRA